MHLQSLIAFASKIVVTRIVAREHRFMRSNNRMLKLIDTSLQAHTLVWKRHGSVIVRIHVAKACCWKGNDQAAQQDKAYASQLELQI